MSAGHVAHGANINRHTPGVSARETENRDQFLRDLVQRELEQAAASLVVVALAGSDAPMVLRMLGVS